MVTGDNTDLELGRFKITLAGEDEDGNEAGEASRNTVLLSVVKAGSIVIDNTSKDKTLLLAESQTELASFTIEPDGSATDLETLVFTLSGTTPTSPLADFLSVEVA